MEVKHITLGPEFSGDITLSGGVLKIEVDEETAGLKGGLHIDIPVTYFIDAAAEKLGGTPTELAIASILDAALKAIA